MVTGRADARPVWWMRLARTAPDCGQIGPDGPTSLSRVVIRHWSCGRFFINPKDELALEKTLTRFFFEISFNSVDRKENSMARLRILTIFVAILCGLSACNADSEDAGRKNLISLLVIGALNSPSSGSTCPGSDKVAARIRNNDTVTHTYRVYSSSNGTCSGTLLAEYVVPGNNSFTTYQCFSQASMDGSRVAGGCTGCTTYNLTIGKRYFVETNTSGCVISTSEE